MKSPAESSGTVSKALVARSLTPQQQAALEREQKRTDQYNEYLKMAQGMDFTALRQHKIIYQSGVDFQGRAVVVRTLLLSRSLVGNRL